MALFVVISRCTLREYRLRSIELLQKMGPRREGVWEAAQVATLGLRMDEQIEHARKLSELEEIYGLPVSGEYPDCEEGTTANNEESCPFDAQAELK